MFLVCPTIIGDFRKAIKGSHAFVKSAIDFPCGEATDAFGNAKTVLMINSTAIAFNYV